ncbi:MAG TPA: hypothetical protein VD999_01170 [Vitreimonas sp.]|nr:hypothetical protein [Vitreimonas sp.]
MRQIDIYELQHLPTLLEIYRQLEDDKVCVICDDGLAIGVIVPVTKVTPTRAKHWLLPWFSNPERLLSIR